MKKFLCVLLLALGVATTVDAQVVKYRATDVAYMSQNDNGSWSQWSAWEKVSMLIVMNLDKAIVQIYSSEPQEFDIVNTVSDWKSDSEGGQQIEFLCVDKNGLRCNMRFRVQSDGLMQMYVDYRNVIYAYVIEPRE